MVASGVQPLAADDGLASVRHRFSLLPGLDAWSSAPPPMRRLLMVAALVAAVSKPTAAQRLGPTEQRPSLRDVTDTNDAKAYFDRGIASFERDPETAAAA